ncbi:MAG: hypothetical protein KDK07_09360 [Bauldia sp.]|nr:hypothetical protein [Bauldia sp.]
MRGTLRAAFLTLSLCAGPARAEPLVLDVVSADFYRDDLNGNTLSIELSPTSAAEFGDYTGRRVGCLLDLLVDGRVVVTANVNEPVTHPSFMVAIPIDDVVAADALARSMSSGEASVVVDDPENGSPCPERGPTAPETS